MLQSRKWKSILAMALTLVMLTSLFGVAAEDKTQGVTDTTVKIGYLGALTGPLAFISVPFLHGMQAYYNQVNDDGGVYGRKIELIAKDDEFDPAKSLHAMETLLFDDQVFAVVGQGGTPNIMATMDLEKELGIPAVYFGSGAAALTTAGPNFFPVQPTYDFEGRLLTKFALTHFEAKKIVVLYQNDSVGRDGLMGVHQALELLDRKDALPEEGVIAFGAADTDFSVQAQLTKNLEPDAVILYGLAAAAGGILKEFEKIGLNVPTLTTYSNADPSFANLVGLAAPNALKNMYATGWTAQDDPVKLEPYFAMQEKYYPGEAVNAFTTAGWLAAELFVEGLKNAGENPTWEAYITGMESLVLTGGLTPDIRYAPGLRQGVSQMNLYKVVYDEATKVFTIAEELPYTTFE